MKLQFNLPYFLFSFFIFIIEVSIATVFKDWYFVRAFLGDILVVILLYTLVCSFFKVRNTTILVLSIFAFSVVVEVLQYFKIAEHLGFKEGSIGYIVIGNYFSWEDIVCYAIGCLVVLGVEYFRSRN